MPEVDAPEWSAESGAEGFEGPEDVSDSPSVLPDSGGWMERLMATTGGEPLPKIEGDYQLDKPMAFVVRGIQKMAGVDGMPAIADVVIGGFLFTQQSNTRKAEATENVRDEEPESDDVDGISTEDIDFDQL